MNNIILFDDVARDHLLPLTFTRPVCELRVGILKIRHKWERWLNGRSSCITQDYLAEKFPIYIEDQNFVVNGSVLPSEMLCRLIKQLEPNEALLQDGELIAAKLGRAQFEYLMNEEEIEELKGFEVEDTPFVKINRPWDLFQANNQAIRDDFKLLTENRISEPLSSTNKVLGQHNVFIEEGAKVECAILNAQTGPIYVGKNAEIMEGAILRGPVALCEHAIVKMGAKIYGATTLGPHCKGGGEIKNAILTGYCSKAHDGYLGDSVLGEWCNMGADSNTSNLKNNYAEVKLWDYPNERFLPSGTQFCGLIMGDHSKCGINTMFNTGTVVGVFANIFGSGYPRNFVPSFAWGGSSGYSTYKASKAMDTARLVMARRGKELDDKEEALLQHVYEETAQYRAWEKVATE
ncbi:MAG: GlmU family protein [Bacteroidota bacterium]